jgi:hypothetical protein
MKNFIEKHAFLLICLLFLAGFILKSVNLWDNIIFAYDQGRDAQRIAEIASLHHFKLVGPDTDIPGVFNGPLFYYVLAPVYALSRFDPNFVALFMLFINAVSVFLLYYFSQILFKSKTVGVLACFLWIISYEQANYARFISNASFMEISALVFFIGLALYFLKEKNIGLPLSVLGFSIGVQFNFYLLYLVIFYPLCFVLFRRKSANIKNVFLSIGILILFFSSFIIAELKWNFVMTHSFLRFVSYQSSFITVEDSIGKYLQSFAGPIYNSLFSFNLFIGFLITVALIVCSYFAVKDKKILVFFYLGLFSTLPLFGFKSGVLLGEVVNGPILPFYALLYALGISWLLSSGRFKLFGIALLSVIILSNIVLFINNHFIDISLFNRRELILKDEKNAIDYTYKSAQNKPFSVCALTGPLFVNTLWGYLYHWYGLGKYGYLPYWSGQKQDLAESLLPYDVSHVGNRYFIIESIDVVPREALMAMTYLEDNTSRLDEVRHFGNVTVEKRTLQAQPRTFIDTQELTAVDLAYLKNIFKKESRYTCYNNY